MPAPEPACQVFRSLDLIGEKWSLLIVRNALRGQTRYSEFSSLGIPSDILAARLRSLVAAGIMTRMPYREPGGRERFCYPLTPMGEGLRLVIAALIQWTDEHNPAPQGIAARVVDTEGRDLELAFVDHAGRTHSVTEAVIVPGPASSTVW